MEFNVAAERQSRCFPIGFTPAVECGELRPETKAGRPKKRCLAPKGGEKLPEARAKLLLPKIKTRRGYLSQACGAGGRGLCQGPSEPIRRLASSGPQPPAA